MSTRLTLVLGGARSGKSRHAEALLAKAPPPWTYIATATALDDEMRERVALHRARRNERWRTVEAPLDLAGALAESEDPVLVDCLTLWLTNLMLGGHAIEEATERLESVLPARQAPTVLVSNEVGLGIVPDNPLARCFRDAQGRLNQRMATLCDRVVFMVAGLPMEVK
jgi:adenosylcobinamide kinase/adenosylcobinamide-phosphate guanylyltransferase